MKADQRSARPKRSAAGQQTVVGAARRSPKRVHCSTTDLKSCDCVRECREFLCRLGECETFIDINAPCFDRPPEASVLTDGISWDGGSSVPPDDEVNVRFYRGISHKRYAEAGQISREEALVVDRVKQTRPLTECPESCSLRGACLKHEDGSLSCVCRWGFAGRICERVNDAFPVCYNDCNGRGECRRGFCHCQEGWWGKDCSSSQAFAAHSARRAVDKLKVYAYELPWQEAFQREVHLGWQDHDSIYTAYREFAIRFYRDKEVRTENPWEANFFYIPALEYAYSGNVGDSVVHGRRAIEYVRATWPFFNRTGGTDHFLWLTADRGACAWPGRSTEPDLANVVKVVHFGFHHRGSTPPPGWHNAFHNQEWGCFHPTRDISAAVYYGSQASDAEQTHGVRDGAAAVFDPTFVPPKLLFFAGGIRHDDPEYSGGVRQALHKAFGAGQHENVTINDGGIDNYTGRMRAAKFCLAPSGHGWGIRLAQLMLRGCIPLIIQDDIYQTYEDILPYSEFSIRFPSSRIPHIVELLGAVSDADVVRLRKGVAKHWPAFLWDERAGGRAYEFMIRSIEKRWMNLNARHHF